MSGIKHDWSVYNPGKYYPADCDSRDIMLQGIRTHHLRNLIHVDVS
ncbi:MAG TPA: hypothetical protein VN451_06820 [Chitinophagaceae bacterium]|nr:hypothetical protein [Chitinophagaceae bacterium]